MSEPNLVADLAREEGKKLGKRELVEWLKTHASFHSDDHIAYMRLSWEEWQALRRKIGET